jgi:hypothetical protein
MSRCCLARRARRAQFCVCAFVAVGKLVGHVHRCPDGTSLPRPTLPVCPQGNYIGALECMERGLVLRKNFFGAEAAEVSP